MTDSENLFIEDPWQNIHEPCYPDGQRLYLNDDRFWVSLNEYNEYVFFIEDFAEKIPKKKVVLNDVEIDAINNISTKRVRLFCTLKENTLKDQFAIVAKDVAHHCSRYKNDVLFSQVIRRINSWSEFLKPTRKGLKFSELIGFWGEFHVVLNELVKKYEISKCIDYWIGPDRKNQDFTMDKLALEVKTSFSGSNQDIRISSVSQLEKLTDKLIIIHLLINETSGDENYSLSEFDNKFLEIIGDDQVLKLKYLNKVSRLLGKATNDQLEKKFIALGYSLYDVTGNFSKTYKG